MDIKDIANLLISYPALLIYIIWGSVTLKNYQKEKEKYPTPIRALLGSILLIIVSLVGILLKYL